MRLLLLFLTLFSCTLFAETIPLDLYSALKELQYAPTKNILVIRVSDQTLSHYLLGKLVASYPVSTAKNGVGQVFGSERTPLGLHCISSKHGADAEIYTIFVARKNTGKIWQPHKKYKKEDLILTRILCLEGLEQGFNRGKNKENFNVDSYLRNIYIHGTNHEKDLGKPLSQGCIRMGSKDIIALFDKVEEGTLVWIKQ